MVCSAVRKLCSPLALMVRRCCSQGNVSLHQVYVTALGYLMGSITCLRQEQKGATHLLFDMSMSTFLLCWHATAHAPQVSV